MKARSLATILLTGLAGAVSLTVFSAVQKSIIGVDPFILQGYLVPTSFGTLFGVLIGLYLNKCHGLAHRLSERLEELERFLPMCSKCKRVRVQGGDMADPDAWKPVEDYLASHSGVEVTHGLCPTCACELYGHECKHRTKDQGSDTGSGT